MPLRPDQFLADAFPAGYELDMLDAEYFLTHGGQRGPQTTILTPGNYRLNTYLWDLSIYNAVDVAEGFVGVVKSNVIDSVHFGNLVVDKPNSCQQKTVSTNASGEAVAAKEAKSMKASSPPSSSRSVASASGKKLCNPAAITPMKRPIRSR